MTLRYVALGDSYTIGTSVNPDQRWPDRLVATLGATADGRPRLELVANLAVNGAASDDVRGGQLPRLEALRPDFVSLLVGVNDVVRRVSAPRSEATVAAIFDGLLARLPADRLLAVTTPDYTVTPAGADYGDPASQRAGIVRSNATFSELATSRGIAVVDIFDLSQRAAHDRSLVAHDGLHPSASQYDLWVARIAPVILRLLGVG